MKMNRNRITAATLAILLALSIQSPPAYAAANVSPAVITLKKPYPVVGDYGITFENIMSKFDSISAAAFTDAKATIRRNETNAKAISGFRSYISPGALAVDPNIGEAKTYIKQTMLLMARIARARNVVFVATTVDERVATKAKMAKLSTDASWMGGIIDSMYGINTEQPPGSVFTSPDCSKGGAARSHNTYPDGLRTGFLVISLCPSDNPEATHLDAILGMAHEYTHSIQVAVLKNVLLRESYEPCWLREGAAEWVSASVSPTFEEYLSAKHLHPYYLTSDGLKYRMSEARTWADDEVADYLKRANNPKTCASTNEYALAYSLGAALTEALVAIGGSESFFVLQERLRNGETSNQAFKNVYGKTWKQVVNYLAPVVAKKITLSWNDPTFSFETRPAGL